VEGGGDMIVSLRISGTKVGIRKTIIGRSWIVAHLLPSFCYGRQVLFNMIHGHKNSHESLGCRIPT
jgi:hypothetical protein